MGLLQVGVRQSHFECHSPFSASMKHKKYEQRNHKQKGGLFAMVQ